MAEPDKSAAPGLYAVIKSELETAGFEDAKEIGHGGFGVVFRCREPALNRVVAVKVLTSSLDKENRARFLREQHAMGQLSGHPNIVDVLRTGVASGGRPFIVMPYHRRGSLDSSLRTNGPVEWGAAIRIGIKLAGALETAHRIGIVHRDVKPANVLLTAYGEPQLSDFGIARMAGAFTTSTGTITGSPAFTAPEVLAGEPPSVASDVYGLGATLFCLITGHAAFERRSGEQVVAQFLRITSEPIPRLQREGLPDAASTAIERAMARDPADRPVSAAEFGNQLREIERDHGLPIDDMALPTETDASLPRPYDDRSEGTATYSRTQSAQTPPRKAEGVVLGLPMASTKYRPPAPARELVPRSRIIQLLHQAGRRRLLLIHAPAGFGKSTLAAQWCDALTEEGFSVAWLSVDADDNNVVWFLAHLTEAIRQVHPDLAAELGQAIEEYGAQAVRYVLTALINEIDHGGAPLVLVIDDWHRVTSTESTNALRFLLEDSCRNLQIVVTSRNQAGLPLSAMRVRDELVEIDAAALRFDLEESRQFLVDLRGLSLEQKAIIDLRNTTDGWIAALQLVSLSLRGREDPAEFISHLSGRHRAIGEYLAENVLGSLEPEVLDFLLATSATERICGDLASELAQIPTGHAMLEEIERRDLFLQPLDEDREWFRYHHLFVEYLRRRLERDHPGRSSDLHRSAARWFADHNLLSEAVDQSLAAEDQNQAIALVEIHGLELIERSQMSSLLGLIAKLPPTAASGRPRLRLAEAWAHVLLHHPPAVVRRALESLRTAVDGLDPSAQETEDIRVEAGLVQAAEELFGDRIDGLVQPVTDCMARMDTVRPFVLAGAANAAAFESIYRYDFEAAIRWQEWAEPFHAKTTGPFTAVYGYCFAGIAANEMLDIAQAERQFRRAYQLARRSGGNGSHATRLAGALLGDLLYEQGHLDEAEQLLDSSYELGAEGGAVDVMLATYGTGSRIKAIRGDLDAATRRLGEGANIAAALSLPRLSARIDNERIRMGLERGEPGHQTRRAEAHPPSFERARPRVNGIEAITAELEEDSAIRVLAADGSAQHVSSAHERAEAAVARIKAQRRPKALLRARLREASTLFQARGFEEALPTFVPVVAECERVGLLRLLCDDGTQTRIFLTTLVEKRRGRRDGPGAPQISEVFINAVRTSVNFRNPLLG